MVTHLVGHQPVKQLRKVLQAAPLIGQLSGPRHNLQSTHGWSYLIAWQVQLMTQCVVRLDRSVNRANISSSPLTEVCHSKSCQQHASQLAMDT